MSANFWFGLSNGAEIYYKYRISNYFRVSAKAMQLDFFYIFD